VLRRARCRIRKMRRKGYASVGVPLPLFFDAFFRSSFVIAGHSRSKNGVTSFRL
jgi:hypothetical protein